MIEQFNKVFVISDLHLGGRPGYRAFREAPALAAFIGTVQHDPAAKVALVINGDIIDFLAGGPDTPEFNPRPAAFVRSLNQAGDELQPVFSALGELVRDPRNRRLVLQLGNHDLELALPSAKEAFLEALQVTDSLAHRRITFETGGHGWFCMVGQKLIQVIHGNVADPWNAVDHAGLDRATHDAHRGATLRPPKTNAGTLMVCHVLNKIKDAYPFVDLLKPEDASLMAVMAEVDAPTHYRGLMRAMGQLPVTGASVLLRSDPDATSSPNTPPTEAEQAMLQSLASVPLSISSDEILKRAEANLDEDVRVRSLVLDDHDHLRSAGDFAQVKWQQLASAIARLRGVPALESLRLALQKWAERDRSFDESTLDEMDRRILSEAMPGVDILIAGHTHLPRFEAGHPTYVNTGTWMRVLRLGGSQYLASDQVFQAFFDVVGKRHTLAQLDAMVGLDPRMRPVAVVDDVGPRLVSVMADGTLDTKLEAQPR